VNAGNLRISSAAILIDWLSSVMGHRSTSANTFGGVENLSRCQEQSAGRYEELSRTVNHHAEPVDFCPGTGIMGANPA